MGESKNCCARGIATIWLVIFNILFALIGAGLLVIGVLLRFNSSLFDKYVKDLLAAVELNGVDLWSALESVSIVLIIIGAVIVIIALMGLCGGLCKIKLLLTVFSIVMIGIFIVEVTITILLIVFKDQIQEKIKDALKTSIEDFYTGYLGTDAITVGWNFIMSKFECCGVDDYDDFTIATLWVTNITYSGSDYNLTTPLYCCEMEGTYPSSTLPATADCAVTPNSIISYYQDGCWAAAVDYVWTYRLFLIIGVSLLFLFQIINIATACILREAAINDEKAADKKKDRQMRAMNRIGPKNGNKTGGKEDAWG